MFITFEGPDGSGKTTAMASLAAWLSENNASVVTTREPGGTSLGERIRALVLDGEQPEPYTALLLFLAARSELVSKVIRPALQRHQVVLCDRFTDSTLAYQGFGEGIPVDDIRLLNRLATGGLTPDITVLLDIEPVDGLLRRERAGDLNAMDRRDLEFHTRVREGFLTLASEEPARWLVVDAASPPGTIHARLVERIASSVFPL